MQYLNNVEVGGVILKSMKSKVGAFLVGILLGASITGVFADTAYGIWGYYGPHLDYNYKNRK